MEQLLICLSTALIAGLLMSRLAKAIHLPAVTSYLLAGLLLGPFFLGRLGLSDFGIGFGTLKQVDSLSLITQVALGFIAFVIGNEFRLSALKRMGRQAVTVGIAQAVITRAWAFRTDAIVPEIRESISIRTRHKYAVMLPAAHLFCLSVSLMGYSSFHFTFTFSNFRCRGSDKGYTETQICK